MVIKRKNNDEVDDFGISDKAKKRIKKNEYDKKAKNTSIKIEDKVITTSPSTKQKISLEDSNTRVSYKDLTYDTKKRIYKEVSDIMNEELEKELAELKTLFTEVEKNCTEGLSESDNILDEAEKNYDFDRRGFNLLKECNLKLRGRLITIASHSNGGKRSIWSMNKILGII